MGEAVDDARRHRGTPPGLDPPAADVRHRDRAGGGAVRLRPGDGGFGVTGHLGEPLRLAVVHLRRRQVLWLGIGAVAFVAFARFDYRRWRQLRLPLLLVSVGLLFVVLLPGFGVTSGGSSRWIGFGMFRIQPSELMKLALAVFAADLLTRRVDRVTDPKSVLLPVLGVFGVAGALIMAQPDMGTALVLACIAFGGPVHRAASAWDRS